MRYPKIKDIFNFKIDYIDVQGEFIDIQASIKGLDTDNSNVAQYYHSNEDGSTEQYTLTKANAPKYAYVIYFYKNNRPCYCRHKGKEYSDKFPPTNDFLRLYGSAFQLNTKLQNLFFISSHIIVEKLKRLDLALDLPYNIKTVLNKFKGLTGKGATINGNNGDPETQYIGGYKKSNNKRYLIRIYDKIKDIRQKYTHDTHLEYLEQDNITRIEVEIRSEQCHNLDFNKLYDDDYLYGVFKGYVCKHTLGLLDNIPMFQRIEDIKLHNIKKGLEASDIDAIKLIGIDYLNMFLGYANKIKRIGACPVEVLLDKRIIQKGTILDINDSIKDNKFNIESYIPEIQRRNVSLARNQVELRNVNTKKQKASVILNIDDVEDIF